MIKRKICIITGTRAEYGLLSSLMKAIDKTPQLSLQVIATGMHLSPEHGLTYKEIEKDGIKVDRKIEMLLSSDTPSAISKSTAIGLIGFADAFNDLKPDLIIVLGDRFEIFSACIAALFDMIPIAHIHGGETTLGAFDESIRHSISKMAWWHFVAADEYRNRVIQLGESKDRIFNVGGLGVDLINKLKFLSKKQLINSSGLKFKQKNLIITYHPTTLEKEKSEQNFKTLLDVLSEEKNIYLIFTMPNADSDSRVIKKMIDEFVIKNSERSISFTSMGYLRYLSTLKYVDGVVGNSSSGLTEAPTFKIGTINIGDRQKGRLESKSIINCTPTFLSIKKALRTLYSQDFQKELKSTKNPYGEGNAIDKIINILKKLNFPKELKKEFQDL